ncbi:RNA helicase [Tulasnella sp. 408]|nr:RNA helicase [Tulasnella sp. 408]
MSDVNTDDFETVSEISEQAEIILTFDQLGLKDDLLRGIHENGRDVIVQAEAGMGKTSTSAIAILQRIDDDLHETQVLILSPTRELATQTQSVIVALGEYLNVQCHACVGGTSVAEDISKLGSGVHIVSGTAGRVLDMIKRKKLRTQNIKMLVFEGADEMFSKGFREQLYDIYRYLPQGVQVVFLGITLPDKVLEMTEQLMEDPIRILLKRDESTLKNIKQYFAAVQTEDQKFDTLISLFDTLEISRAVVFCNEKRKHGGMPQEERDQSAVDFRAGGHLALITTDTRGIDMPEISHVIHFDLPSNRQSYILRIGRFGLPGSKTVFINLVTVPEEVKILRGIG